MASTQDPLPAARLERAASLLSALAADKPDALREWLATNSLDENWCRWIRAQGLAPFTFRQLQRAASLSLLRENVQARLRADTYQGAALNALQRQETARVLGALEDAGVETVLLKGTPLAYTVYDDPLCRFKGDLDAWIRLDQLPEATAALGSAGYRVARKEERPPELVRLIGGEQQMVSDVPGSGLIELQWPAFRGEWVRHTTRINHEAIWERRTPVMIEGRRADAMAPEDMLIHLCLHQAINHQFAKPWLRSLLDVHLVIQRQSPDWEQVAARARSWRVSTVTWTVLGLARQLLGTPVPAQMVVVLSPSAWRRWAVRQLRLERKLVEMSPGGYHHGRFLIQLLLVDRGRDMARLIGRGLFPEGEWLRARYAADTPSSLWRARLTHPWKLITAGRA
jgi:hypothetical protein